MSDSNLESNRFHTTKWTLVCQAGGLSSDQKLEATEQLCKIYWKPVYLFVLKSAGDIDRARDLTQGFFQDMLSRNIFGTAEKEKGKFRSYLLAACKNYLAKDFQKESAEKRGGNRKHFSLDFDGPDTVDMIADQRTPEQIFDRQWAIAVLAQVMKQLEENYRGKGKGPLFDQLKHRLTSNADTGGYQEIGKKLGISESAVKMQIYRMKKKYRMVLRETVENIVQNPDLVDEEIEYLFIALSF